MGNIKLLPPHLINQIAAGEVVERPASVVKELVENSIDAGADQIIIEIEKGGRELIKITDNGIGMDKEDAIKMLLQHATSKIASLEDLQNIHTLGFRGEAIASIASVSHFIVKTKPEKDLSGTQIAVVGGIIEKQEETGSNKGTQIEVKHLFFNTPARQKFLKTESTEYGHILNCMTNFALSFPEITFKLFHNKRLVFDLPKTEDLRVRIHALLGKDYQQSLLEVFYGGKELKIQGLIGKPDSARSGKSGQYLFINNREIKNAYLNHAILDAYHTLLPHGNYPIYIINLNIAPHLVDVNVHPRKLEVRFADQQSVYSALKQSVKASLEKFSLIPDWKTQNNFMKFHEKSEPAKLMTGISTNPSFKFENRNLTPKSFTEAMNFTKEIAAVNQDFQFEHEKPKTNLKPLAQVAESYIVAESKEGIVIIDQHAAHERVNYMKLMENLERGEVMTQILLIPLQWELSYKESQILEENKETLEKIGFSIENFGSNTVSVTAIPACLSDADIPIILKGAIEDLAGDKPIKSLMQKQEKVINYIACRSAIKFGKTLSENEMLALLEQLESLSQKHTCPHGRPTMIKMNFCELEKQFKRT